jgi:hypothetical protein
MAQMPFENSPEDWGNWYLAPSLKLKHKTKPHFTIDVDDFNSTSDILKCVFITLHFSCKIKDNLSAIDATCMLFAIREILKFSGVAVSKNVEFDGYKCAKQYYKHVVNKRNVPNALRLFIFERDKFKCVYCGLGAKDDAVLNVDHILPISKGGSNEPNNLQTLCRACNNGKADRIMPDDAPAPNVHLA